MSEPVQRLAGQVAVVTGASRGIGRAIAIRLGALGATVVLNYLKEDARCAEAAQAVIAAGGPAPSAVRADVGRPEEARRLIEGVLARHGRIDVLINNAARQTSALLHKMSDADWQSVLDVNLSAVFYLCRAALPAMFAARSGHIVNIASASSYMARKGAGELHRFQARPHRPHQGSRPRDRQPGCARQRRGPGLDRDRPRDRDSPRRSARAC